MILSTTEFRAHNEGARNFARAAAAIAIAKGSRSSASLVAGADTKAGILVTKAGSLSTDVLGNDPDWRAASEGFLSLVRTRSILGAINGWRKVPANTNTFRQTATLDAGFVAEGDVKPISDTLMLDTVRLPAKKVQATVLLTQELAKAGLNGFESSVSRDLAAAVADAENAALLSNAAATGSTPAGLLHGVAPVTATGNLADDFTALVDAFAGDLLTAAVILHPRTAVALAARGIEGIGARGGELFGVPAVTSTAVPHDTNGSSVILVDPARVIVVDEGVRMDSAAHASLEFGATWLSLWQRNILGLRAERLVDWAAMDGCVAVLEGV